MLGSAGVAGCMGKAIALVAMVATVMGTVSGEVTVVVFGDSRGGARVVGGEWRVSAAAWEPGGHGKEEDEEGPQNGKQGNRICVCK